MAKRRTREWGGDKASRSAISAAMLRYMAVKDRDLEKQGPDIYAELFLPPNFQVALRLRFFRKLMRKNFVGGYEYLYARTAHYDRLFNDALSDGFDQIVFLGAGYDTRAIRFSGNLGQVRIFELDSQKVISRKKEILNKAGIAIPDAVRMVPIDFDTDDLKSVLEDAGFETGKMTLFIWEGVTMYLTEEAVKSTLRFIRNHASSGSRVGFDYVYPGALTGDESLYGAEETAQAVNEGREPFIYGIMEEDIAPFLAELGFEVIEHYSPKAFTDTYLLDSKDEPLGRLFGFMGNVVSRVK